MDIVKEIKNYCRINNISDVDGVINKCLIQGFNILKYGISPQNNFNIENNIGNKKNDLRGKDEEKHDGQALSGSKSENEEKEIKSAEKEKKPVEINVRKIKIIKK